MIICLQLRIALHGQSARRPVAGAYIDAFTSHVNVGFFLGARLDDPAGLLEGTGKFMRHVKLRPGQRPDAAALTALIENAYRDMRQMLPGPQTRGNGS